MSAAAEVYRNDLVEARRLLGELLAVFEDCASDYARDLCFAELNEVRVFLGFTPLVRMATV